MKLDWSIFKNYVNSKSLAIQYVEINNMYFLKAADGFIIFECELNKNNLNDDLLDFETNYKTNANQTVTDIDGIPLMRMKASKKGWTFAAIPIEFETSQIDSLYAKNVDGTNRSGVSLKFYNSSGTEITEQGLLEANEGTIVRSVIDFEPAYDYEIIGGTLRIDQAVGTTQNCRLWIIAAPDIPAAYGGSKEMAGGVNLKFLAPDNNLSIDGRVSKTLIYNAATHSNKLRFIFEHTAGLKIPTQILIELYRL